MCSIISCYVMCSIISCYVMCNIISCYLMCWIMVRVHWHLHILLTSVHNYAHLSLHNHVCVRIKISLSCSVVFTVLQVSPSELEALLLNHPGIVDAAVIGIPDNQSGEAPKAFIVKRSGIKVTENDIHKFINGLFIIYLHITNYSQFFSWDRKYTKCIPCK